MDTGSRTSGPGCTVTMTVVMQELEHWVGACWVSIAYPQSSSGQGLGESQHLLLLPSQCWDYHTDSTELLPPTNLPDF